MSALTVAIAGGKGGIGKSVTSLSIANILSEDKKVLLIDMDPNNSSTCHFIEDYEDIIGRSMNEILLNKIDAPECIINVDENLDLLPSDYILEDLIPQLDKNPDYIFLLNDIIDELKDNYDFIIIDTQPSRLHLTRTAVLPAEILILPAQLDKWGLRGWSLCLKMVTDIVLPERRKINDKDPIITMLPTFYEKRRILKESYLDALKQMYSKYILKTKITQRAEVARTYSVTGQKLLKDSESYKEYKGLVDEILKIVKKKVKS